MSVLFGRLTLSGDRFGSDIYKDCQMARGHLVEIGIDRKLSLQVYNATPPGHWNFVPMKNILQASEMSVGDDAPSLYKANVQGTVNKKKDEEGFPDLIWKRIMWAITSRAAYHTKN